MNIYDDNTAEKKSSNISRVDYDPENKTLDVVFKGGREYRYSDVPKDIITGMQAASSIGGFVYSSVRDHFKVEELT